MSPDEVVADYKAASLVTLASGGSERLLTWLSLRGDEISREEVATGSLEIMMMPLAGGFTGTPSEALTMSTLVCTSDDAAFVDTIAAAQRGPELMKDARLRGTLPLAVRLTGRFATAFPEGPPRKEDEGGNGAGPEWLKESAEEGAVVLVSDVDLIYDRFCVRKIGFFGQPLYAPANDNLNFLLNLVEELSGSGALIGLRSRGTFDRPFHKVIELERLAQKRWQQEELALTRKLREMQARLDELQQAKSDDQRFILSPEQKREIESFRKQRFETQKKLKEVRKNLRRDIEGLGLRLKVLNAGLVPVLVIAYGLLHGWRRRKKAAAPPGRDGLPAGG
jgi:hypothetical protein